MEIIDITLPLTETMVIWPGDPPMRINRVQDIHTGAEATVSSLTMGVHTGTHVDAPCHFLEHGTGVEALDLHVLIGSAQVVEINGKGMITAAMLEKLDLAEHCKRLLFRTENSRQGLLQQSDFSENFTAIEEDGARWLAGRGILLVGLDYLSVAPFTNGAAIHRILLEAGIVLIEGLDLRRARPGTYELVCLPLKITGADGAPARVILIKREETNDIL